jgi:hypothetical protein
VKHAILPDYKLNSAGLGLGLYYTLLGREDNDQTNYLALGITIGNPGRVDATNNNNKQQTQRKQRSRQASTTPVQVTTSEHTGNQMTVEHTQSSASANA